MPPRRGQTKRTVVKCREGVHTSAKSTEVLGGLGSDIIVQLIIEKMSERDGGGRWRRCKEKAKYLARVAESTENGSTKAKR
jgi:hypothetical protein